MKWSSLKIAVLRFVLERLAGSLWATAQDAVRLLADRDDLSGPEKLALARTILLDWVVIEGKALTVSAANFLLEAAVQFMRLEKAGPG